MTAAGETGTETIGLVQQFLERARQLYSLPAVAAEILRLTDQPQIDVRAVKKCLETDPALAARILRVANSSLFGATRQVTDLNQALTLLGIRPLKMLVLGFSLPKDLLAGLEADVLGHYWRQAITKAVAARELCEQFWRSPGEEAFLAGLVQDIGVLVLLKELGPSYQQLWSHARTRGCSLLECELDTLGFDHLVLSARLLSHWGFPADFCAAISVPPDKKRVGELTESEAKLPRILHLAHLVSQIVDQPYGSALNELLSVGAEYCDLTYERLRPIAAGVQQSVSEMAAAFSLELPDGRDYGDLLVEAHERLAAECIAVPANPRRGADERSLLQMAENLRDDVARCVHRTEQRAGHEVKTSIFGVQHSAHVNAAQQAANRIADDHYEPTLEAKVGKVIQDARHARRPVALAIIEIDKFSELVLKLGPTRAGDLILVLRDLAGEWIEPSSSILLGDSRLGIVLDSMSRREAVDLARDIAIKARSTEAAYPSGLSLSVGLAALEVVSKNYPPAKLVEAAFGCLSAAQLSGGNTVKSIAV